MFKVRLAASFLAIAICSTSAIAQEIAPTSNLTAGDAANRFGSREQVLDVSISPDGKKVAFITPGPKQATVVQVTDLATNNTNAVNYADGNPLSISSCGWSSSSRIVCMQYGVSDRDGRLLAYSRLGALDDDGQNVKALGAFNRSQRYIQQSDGFVIDWLDGSAAKVLIARRYVAAGGSSGDIGVQLEGLGVDLVDTITGKSERRESPEQIARAYLSDGQGRIRIKGVDEALKLNWQTSGDTTFKYRAAGSNDWKLFSIYKSTTDEGLYPIAIDAVANSAYALENYNGKEALFRVALDGSMKTELAYANPQVDVSGVIRVGRQGRVIGASYSTDVQHSVYFDPEYEKLAANLSKALPKLPLIRIIDASADETKLLLYAASDVDPGRYYVFDKTAKKLAEVARDRPALVGVPLGTVKPVSYPAADGTMIPGYLTLPFGSDGKNIPAIIMPHGGPAARDEWGFDWFAQFFVNRGYAVLQPNYRGSTGYGDEWYQDNGFQSWQTALGDIVDAGKWLVSEGVANPKKLAIVGWSYGGYAALQTQVVNADLFKAVVAVAPVTDLGMLRGEQRGFTNMRIAQEFIGKGEQIELGSPTRHAAKFKAPVLLFHGTNDINVDSKESVEMHERLKKAGKSSELVLYPAIDHQLPDSSVRSDMLLKADSFLRATMGE
jgi:dipeptidyl aminopeptidase/acylaminoacyl peptidase